MRLLQGRGGVLGRDDGGLRGGLRTPDPYAIDGPLAAPDSTSNTASVVASIAASRRPTGRVGSVLQLRRRRHGRCTCRRPEASAAVARVYRGAGGGLERGAAARRPSSSPAALINNHCLHTALR